MWQLVCPQGDHVPTSSARELRVSAVPPQQARILDSDPPTKVAHELATGGFGVVYRHPDRPDEVVKRFNQPESFRGSVLVDLMRIDEWARPSDRAILTERFAWPTAVYRRDRRMTGFSMRAVPPEGQFQLTTAGSTKTQLLQLKYFIDPTFWAGAAVQSTRPELSGSDRIEVSVRLLETIEALHRYGLVYRDFSSNNICVLLGVRPSVMILDVDSIRRADDVETAPIQSPGWKALETDPIRRDVSLAALAAWRILVDDQHAEPDDDQKPTESMDAQLRSLLVRLHRSPEDGSLGEATHALRRLRAPDLSAALFAEAANTGLARNVLAERLGARSNAERKTVALAELHVELEAEIESASGTRRRRLERRLAIRGAGMTPDLIPNDAGKQRLTDREALRRAALDARFSELTDVFLSGELAHGEPGLELDPLLRRSVQHVLAESGDMEFSAVAGEDVVSLDWTWPENDLVSAATVTLEQPGGILGETIVQRDSGEQRGFIHVNGLAGKELRVRCRPAAVSPNGTVIPAVTGRTATLSLPPRPIAPAPRGSTEPDRPTYRVSGPQFLQPEPEPPARSWWKNPWWILAILAMIAVVAAGAVAAVAALSNDEPAPSTPARCAPPPGGLCYW